MALQKFYMLLTLAIFAIVYTEAFTATRRKSSSTALKAWSMPTDMTSWNTAAMFNSPQLPILDITNSWYTVSNPNRGKRVYEDVPYDYTLISAGNNWPSYDSSGSPSKQQRVGPLGPIRKAARWVRRLK
ncbi:hypothetical protein MHU86_23316 [Fragilaria crotonensis]|nr:hypothetical protein MHU86_23316 [Fragilaria crotonensis]